MSSSFSIPQSIFYPTLKTHLPPPYPPSSHPSSPPSFHPASQLPNLNDVNTNPTSLSVEDPKLTYIRITLIRHPNISRHTVPTPISTYTHHTTHANSPFSHAIRPATTLLHKGCSLETPISISTQTNSVFPHSLHKLTRTSKPPAARRAHSP